MLPVQFFFALIVEFNSLMYSLFLEHTALLHAVSASAISFLSVCPSHAKQMNEDDPMMLSSLAVAGCI